VTVQTDGATPLLIAAQKGFAATVRTRWFPYFFLIRFCCLNVSVCVRVCVGNPSAISCTFSQIRALLASSSIDVDLGWVRMESASRECLCCEQCQESLPHLALSLHADCGPDPCVPRCREEPSGGCGGPYCRGRKCAHIEGEPGPQWVVGGGGKEGDGGARRSVRVVGGCEYWCWSGHWDG
jgi:hypothetical protein